MTKRNIINYEMLQGSTFAEVTVIVHDDGCPWDLTGWNFRGQMRASYGGALVERLNLAVSGSVTSGSVAIGLTATQSAAIDADQYYYDCEMYSGSLVNRFQEGEMLLLPEVTTD